MLHAVDLEIVQQPEISMQPVDAEHVDVDPGAAVGLPVSDKWRDLSGKPFDRIGTGLRVEDGALVVDTADCAEEDNTRPITSAAVFTQIGNIDALLQTI